MTALLHAVAEPRRQRILQMCWDTEVRSGDIHRQMPEVTFGAVSQHLRLLERVGAVTVRRAGRERWYRAQREAMGSLAKWLEEMWGASLGRLGELAEAEEGKESRT